MPPRSLLHFHCVLLIFDISCPTQNIAFDRDIWSRHFRCLESLADSYADTQLEELPQHLISSTLFLDAQASLAGNLMAGSFVQAYQTHTSARPRPHDQCKCVSGSPGGLSVTSWLSKYAELSQLALQMRKEVEHGHGTPVERQHHINLFRDDVRGMLKVKCPADSPRHSLGIGVSLAADNAMDRFVSHFPSITCGIRT